MNQGSKFHDYSESEIFKNMTLWKLIPTNRGQLVMVHTDGSASVILPIESINANSFEEEDFESMFSRIKKFVEGIDTDITVQFVMMREKASKDNIDFTKLPSYLSPRGEMLRHLANQNKLFENTYYLSIHCPSKNEARKEEGIVKNILNKIKNRNNAAYLQNKSLIGIEERISKVLETSASLLQMLDSIGSSGYYLKTEQEYWDILQKFTRPSKSKISQLVIDKKDQMHASPRQALFSGVRAEVRKNDFTLDDYYHRVYTLDRAPRQVIYGRSLQVIDSLPFEIIYSVSFRKMTHAQTLNKFKFAVGISRAIDGTNQDAIIEDLTKTANAERIYEHYEKFAFGDGAGIEMSANLVMRVAEDYIATRCRVENVSRTEYLARVNNNLHKSVFSEFGGSEWISEPNVGWFVFNQIIPGMSNIDQDILKKNMVLSVDLPYFLSIYDSKIKNIIHNGVNHFIDLKDNMIPFDLFNPNLPAWNYSISGQTGSGKSVLMNAILTMQFADSVGSKSPIICILDVGGDQGSYIKFMELVKGTSINLSGAVKPKIQMFALKPQRSEPTIAKRTHLTALFLEESNKMEYGKTERTMYDNVKTYFDNILSTGAVRLSEKNAIKEIFEASMDMPFKEEYKAMLELKEGECRPSPDRMNMIMGLLEVILSTSAEDMDAFQMYDQDELSGYLFEAYEHIGATENRYPRISDLYNLLKDGANGKQLIDQSKPEARKLLNKLKNWTIDGQYSMFDQETTIDIDNDVVLADLKGLESNKKLQMMYTLLLSQLFQDKMYFTRDRKKLIVRDEAWSLMKNEKARDFFVEDLRTARKNGFATIAISQLPTDYNKPDPAVGQAITANMQVQIFCKFETESVCAQVGHEFGLQPESIEALKRLGVVKVRQMDGSLKPQYATFMMKIGRNVYVLKNELHPFEYQLYSSSAEDNAILNYYRNITKSFKNLEEVLWYIANGGHKGDLELARYLLDAGYKNKAREVTGGKSL